MSLNQFFSSKIMKRHHIELWQIMVLITACLMAISCGQKRLRANLPTAERMKYALELYEKGKHFDAKTQFRIVTLNAPGSAFIDKAQFYLAECHFELEEYILAGAEYEKLIRLYPRSEYIDDAQYKIGLCYFELSPKSQLDQKYTHKSIEEFQKFLDDYPNSELKEEVFEKLRQVRSKLAKKAYDTADLYRKLSYYESAIVYYDEVLNRYYDTQFGEPALFYKAEVLIELKRHEEAREVLKQLVEKYQNEKQGAEQKTEGKFESRAIALLKEVTNKLATNGSAQK